MTIYYVATNGSNSANGSSASPWKTISYAMQRDLKAGDTVIVRAGTYNEAVVIDHGGSAAGDVTLKSETPGAALIRPPSGAWNAISVAANHVTVDGFDIGGARGDGIEANNVHHITIRNSTVHGSGESGIQFNWSEFITIEGNETYENGSTGWFSGISIYQNSQHHGRHYDAGFSDHRPEQHLSRQRHQDRTAHGRQRHHHRRLPEHADQRLQELYLSDAGGRQCRLQQWRKGHPSYVE